jgi:hypothetical protein
MHKQQSDRHHNGLHCGGLHSGGLHCSGLQCDGLHSGGIHHNNRAGPCRTRRGTSLCEVLVALVLLSATAAWGLQAATAAEAALGAARVRQTQLHRAEWALAELDALPCDSINISRTIVESRWRLSVERDHDALSYRDDVILQSQRGDTVRLHRGGWCN